MNRSRLVVAAALGVALSQPAAARGMATQADVLAGFVVNILKFVSWPQDALPSGSPLVVCQLGDHDIESALRRFDGSALGGRTLRVRRIHDPLDARRCHAVFIGGGESADATAALRAVRDVPTLTLGEQTAFIERGGDVAFFLDGPRLRFAISQANTERASLKVSAQLLKLASEQGPGGR